ncbi:cytochrome c [Deinococcus sp.]|uniref:c-type cytochrome n=1 Tax=Deinococcus sp. TaxID=47478 RepID=UPI0025E91E3E|nr:cytochrome c [Deinococcus sp.]
MKTAVLALGALLLVGAISAGAYRAGAGLSGVNSAPGSLVAVKADGPALFGSNCAGCHGAQAQGGVGPRLAGLVGPWTAPQFSAAVLDGTGLGGQPLAPTMPHFRTAGFGGEPITDAQLADIQAFLKGI